MTRFFRKHWNPYAPYFLALGVFVIGATIFASNTEPLGLIVLGASGLVAILAIALDFVVYR